MSLGKYAERQEAYDFRCHGNDGALDPVTRAVGRKAEFRFDLQPVLRTEGVDATP